MELQRLKLDVITESPTNPREDFDKVELATLSEDIKARGLLQPILVREMGKGFEIIAGHRRFRASKLAECETIDALVTKMTDLEAEEAQLAENEKRGNLKPLERANAYAGILKRHKLTADQLAEKLKVSRSNVYATVRLAKLCTEAKAALKSGALKESIAKLLSQVHPTQQAKATKDILTQGWPRGTPMTYREAIDHLERHYFLDLRKALFNTEDAELDKDAGPCTSCEKRTGAQPELPLEDGVRPSPDSCTDQPCHARKTAAHVAAEATKRGLVLLNEKEVKKIFNQHDDLVDRTAWVRAEQIHPSSGTGQTYASLLTPTQKKELGVLALTPRGNLQELYRAEDLGAAIKATGKLKARKAERSSSSTPAPKKLTPEQKAKAEHEDGIRKKLGGAVLAALVAAAEKAGPTKKMLQMIALKSVPFSEINFERRGLKVRQYYGANPKDVEKLVEKLSVEQLVGLLYEMAVPFSIEHGDPKQLKKECDELGVDVKKVEAAVRAATPAPKEMLSKMADHIETVATESLGKKDGKKVAAKFRKTLKLKKPAKTAANKKKAA